MPARRVRVPGCGLLAAAMLATVSGCRDSPLVDCDRTVQAEVASPDAVHKAAMLEVACGATTRDAYWVLLTPADRGFSPERDRVAVFEGRPDALEWRDGVLHVDYGPAKPFLMNVHADGVRIVYSGTAAAASGR